jgi:hypothetical protein
MSEHIELRVEPDGAEPVHVERIGNHFRVLYSPGLVYGVAAGDEIEVTEGGEFRVVHRGGNLSIRVLCANGVASFAEELERSVGVLLGGRLDGRVQNGLVFTVPPKVGFRGIERVFDQLREGNAEVVWEFGKIYDAQGNELGWWR